MPQVPSSVPQMSQENVRKILKAKGIDRTKFPVCVLAVRGYFLDTMGKPGVNDRGLFDDACFVDSPTGFVSVNWNTDPSSYRKGRGKGSNKGMASLKPGVWDYKIGLHKGKGPACREAGPVTVIRDGIDGDYEDTDNPANGLEFAINHHWGSVLNGTSSAGCQTAPVKQFPSYINLLVAELKRYNQKVFKYVLITESERISILKEIPVIPIPSVPADPNKMTLSWDKGSPRRAQLSKKLISVVSGDLTKYETASDITKLHPQFKGLTSNEKIKIICEFWIALYKFESGWNEKSSSVDVGKPGNKDTYSVGLGQMSVVDGAARAFKATFEQLQTGEMGIDVSLEQMRRQLKNTGLIFLPNKSPYRYWAVALIDNKYSHVAEIIAYVKANA